MAMMSVVYWQPKGRLMTQADRLGPKALCCIHRINRVNSCNALSMMTAPYRLSWY